jgi:hypothetical protein
MNRVAMCEVRSKEKQSKQGKKKKYNGHQQKENGL